MPVRKTSLGNNKGQALIEMLILLPILFLLLLGAADFNLLAVINAKTEIASRYNALHIAYGDRFLYQKPLPPPDATIQLATVTEELFFSDSLDDGPDATGAFDRDVTHNNITYDELAYEPPVTNDIAWDTIFTVLNDNDIYLVHGNHVNFDYDLLGFPFHRYPVLPDETVSPGWVSAIAPSYALHGDFVVIGDPFSGTTGELARNIWLAGAGAVTMPTTAALAAVFAAIILPIFVAF